MTTPPIDPTRDLILERHVDVSPELVWKAWTEPEHIVKWFTPAPWKTVDCEIDLRPGGIFRTVMRSPAWLQRSGMEWLWRIKEEPALWRRYSYRVCDDPAAADPLRRHDTLWHHRRLDLDAMNEAAAGLVGEHDFAAFCRPRPGATPPDDPPPAGSRATRDRSRPATPLFAASAWRCPRGGARGRARR